MKRLPILALLLSGLISLGSCKKDQDPQTATGTDLPGTWRLIGRQCYCSPAPLPHETVAFTDSTYRFVGSSQPGFTSGFYTRVPVTICGLPTPTPGLRLTDALANGGQRQAQYLIHGDTLVLDYGSPCDAPRDTYVRQRQPQ